MSTPRHRDGPAALSKPSEPIDSLTPVPLVWGIIRYSPGSGSRPDDDAAGLDGWYTNRSDALDVASWARKFPQCARLTVCRLRRKYRDRPSPAEAPGDVARGAPAGGPPAPGMPRRAPMTPQQAHQILGLARRPPPGRHSRSRDARAS
jgi:hypothetical protein